MLVRPSPSESANGSAETMFSVLLTVGTGDVLPLPFVAMTVKEPTALEASVRVMVAEVPFPLIFTFETEMAAGANAGTKENVAAVRLEPFTVKPTVGVLSTCVGAIEVMAGTASTVKLLCAISGDAKLSTNKRTRLVSIHLRITELPLCRRSATFTPLLNLIQFSR